MGFNQFQIEGEVKYRGGTEEKSEKFSVRKLIIGFTEKTDRGEFPQEVEFQMINKLCEQIDNVRVGDLIRVHFSLRGRNTEKFGNITNLNAFKLEVLEQNNKEDNVSDHGREGKFEHEVTEDDFPF